jgi:hypothetical protein
VPNEKVAQHRTIYYQYKFMSGRAVAQATGRWLVSILLWQSKVHGGRSDNGGFSSTASVFLCFSPFDTARCSSIIASRGVRDLGAPAYVRGFMQRCAVIDFRKIHNFPVRLHLPGLTMQIGEHIIYIIGKTPSMGDHHNALHGTPSRIWKDGVSGRAVEDRWSCRLCNHYDRPNYSLISGTKRREERGVTTARFSYLSHRQLMLSATIIIILRFAERQTIKQHEFKQVYRRKHVYKLAAIWLAVHSTAVVKPPDQLLISMTSTTDPGANNYMRMTAQMP